MQRMQRCKTATNDIQVQSTLRRVYRCICSIRYILAQFYMWLFKLFFGTAYPWMVKDCKEKYFPKRGKERRDVIKCFIFYLAHILLRGQSQFLPQRWCSAIHRSFLPWWQQQRGNFCNLLSDHFQKESAAVPMADSSFDNLFLKCFELKIPDNVIKRKNHFFPAHKQPSKRGQIIFFKSMLHRDETPLCPGKFIVINSRVE